MEQFGFSQPTSIQYTTAFFRTSATNPIRHDRVSWIPHYLPKYLPPPPPPPRQFSFSFILFFIFLFFGAVAKFRRHEVSFRYSSSRSVSRFLRRTPLWVRARVACRCEVLIPVAGYSRPGAVRNAPAIRSVTSFLYHSSSPSPDPSFCFAHSPRFWRCRRSRHRRLRRRLYKVG